VTIQILLVIGLLILFIKSDSIKTSLCILSVVILIQLADLAKLAYRIDSNNKEYVTPLNAEQQAMILKANSVRFLKESELRIAEFSLLNKKPVNAFYTAHNPGKLTQEKLEILRAGFNFSRQDQDLYLYKVSDLPDSIEVELGYKFYGDYYALPPQGYVSSGPSIKTQKVKTGSLSMLVDKIKTSPLVIIAVSDEASLHLQNSFREYFDNMFHTNLKSLEYRNSYLAVFVNGVLHNEQIGKDKAVEFSGRMLDIDTYVKSAGQPFGSQAIISLNGASLAIGKRGISMVSCMQDQGKLRCISTEFDTHAFEYPY
jgi:hypothetical protein